MSELRLCQCCGLYILLLSESQDYICSAGIVFMLLSWKDGETVLQIKLNLFHNAVAGRRAEMWVVRYLLGVSEGRRP